MQYEQFGRLSWPQASICHSTNQLLVFAIAVLAIFCFHTPLAQAQASCGDIIFIDVLNGGEEFVEPITDCGNPFGVTDSPSVGVTYTSNGEVFGDGDELVVTTALDTLFIEVEFDQRPFDVGGTLFRHEGEDYQQVAQSENPAAVQVSVTEVGTYTLVTTIDTNVPVQVRNNSWLNFLIPVAYAQSPTPGVEVHAVTFTVIAPEPEPTGASSVLFLPGIQASRLYAGEDIVLPGLANNIEAGDKLWEQTNDKRIAALAMDENGESLYDIYTDDVLDEIGGTFIGGNIYKDFLGLLDELKSVDVIDNYLPFAYDWRYSVFDVATQPVQYENETRLLKDELIDLASSSLSSKVTIVAHSNGGLVAKALLHEYGDNELAGVVDKVIMIGTPQLGTPKGVSALLHGQVMEGFGDLLTSDLVLRDTIMNMPGTYTLMPSTRYLDEVLDQPLVQAPDGSDLHVYDGVTTRSELTALLLDTADVIGSNPTIQEPLQLNERLLNNALAEQTILDAWRPPVGVEVYEVVGTGIPTPVAINYEEVPSVTCPSAAAVFLAAQCTVKQIIKPKLTLTNQGDKTVVLGSAQGQMGDKVTAVVDLKKVSAGISINRNHADLTEVASVQTFVDSVIRYPYVGDGISVPEFTAVTNRYTIHAGHSPVTLRITTPDGLVTGIVDGVIREAINGTQFITLAGSSYIIVPDDISDYLLEVIGTGNGVYTLETSELSPQDVQSVIAQFVASTTDTMVAKMDVNDGVMGDLQTDFDGDGVIDEIRTAEGELVVETQVIDTVTTTSGSSGSSATRVGDRAPSPSVLGISTSTIGLTAEQYEQLEQVINSIQSILEREELAAHQLDKLSQILRELLLIINTEYLLLEVY